MASPTLTLLPRPAAPRGGSTAGALHGAEPAPFGQLGSMMPIGMVLSLQRQAGNAAVASLLGPRGATGLAVQRDRPRGGGGAFEPELDSGWYKDALDVGETIVLKPGVRNLRSAPRGWKVKWSVGQPDGNFIELVDIVDTPGGEGQIHLRGKAVGQESIWATAYVGPDDEKGKRVGPFKLKVFPAGSNHGKKATPAPTGGAQAGQPDGTDALTAHRKKWVAAGRVSMQSEIVSLVNSIEKLKALRITTWEKIASKEDTKPLKAALSVAVSIAGYGLGGVIGGLLTSKMAHGLTQEFVKEVAHKGSDKAIAASWSALVASSRASMDKGTLEAANVAAGISEQALQTKSDMLGAYAEAMRLFAIDEERKQAEQFNLDAAGLDDLKMADKIAVLAKLYAEIRNSPDDFARELSKGLIRLKDEQFLTAEAKGHGGDRGKTEREDKDVHDVETRSGNLVLLPVGGGIQFSLGNYGAPDFGFTGFRGIGTGDTNTATFNAMRGSKVKDLPFSVGFRFWGTDPFYRVIKGGLIKVWFGRQPSGVVWLHNDLSENAEEWLASYYNGSSDILSDDVRERDALPGAQKLYDRIKDKELEGASNSDIF